MRPAIPLAVLLLSLFVLISAQADPVDRTWTSQAGKALKATLVGMSGDTVDLKLVPSGRVVTTRIDLLSDADKAYVDEWRGLGFGVKAERWPKELKPMMNFAAKSQGRNANGEYVYTTPSYEFRCDVELQASLIKEYSRAFEGTYFAIANLPLGLDPKPPETRFVVRLFKDRNDYLGAGGPQGSAGVYIVKSKEILVPMESLGIRTVGRKVAIDRRNYDSGTLVHEITHQVMHDWLEALPVWFVEGIAEYMSSVPFDDARFDFSHIDDGVKDHLENEYRAAKTSKGVFQVDVARPEQLMALTHPQWAAAVSSGANASVNYRSAMMLIYFFIHLDGEGDGSSMVAYLQQARGKQEEMKKFIGEYNEAVETYNADLRAYNVAVDQFNAALTAYRTKVETYNANIRRYNAQLDAGVPESKIDPVGEKPGESPKPPTGPKLPKILAENPNGGGPVDLMDGELEARKALFRKRDPDRLWADMESAFTARSIQLREVSAVGGR